MSKRINKLIKSIQKNNPHVLNDIIVVEYKGANEVIVKDKYGLLKSTSDHLRNGHKPTIRTAINETEYCINQFKEIHGNKYNYSKVNYTKDNKKITITCKEHGEFKQTPNVHKNGSGCMKCSYKTHKGLYSMENLKRNKNWDKIMTNFYVFKLSNREEEFYKVGISKDVKRRVRQIARSSNNKYKVECVDYLTVSLKEAIESENDLFKNTECFITYKPNHKFQGHTECYKLLKNRFLDE